MTMTDAYGESDREEAAATLERAIELGVTLFDTANTYGFGENEELLGRVLGPHRDKVVVSTKFGFVMGEGGTPSIDGHPDRVADRCDESLARLGFDHIDLYLLHRPDPTIPIEETVGAMKGLVEAGKVRHIGICEVSAASLRTAHSVHPIAAVQSEYSLYTRGAEEDIIPTCRELGVGFMPFSPLGRAMLTGDISREEQLSGGKDYRASLPRFQGENLAHNLTLVDQAKQIADRLNITPAQLALAWILHQGDTIAPIPGTRRRKWLEQNVAAVDVELDEVHYTDDGMRQIGQKMANEFCNFSATTVC